MQRSAWQKEMQAMGALAARNSVVSDCDRSDSDSLKKLPESEPVAQKFSELLRQIRD